MLSTWFSRFFSKIIDIKQDEYKKVILLQLTIFLIISVLMILKPLGTSLMLSAYGIEIMPLAFVSIALAAVIIHYLLMLLRRHISLIRAIFFNFLFHIIVLIMLAVAAYFKLLYGVVTVLIYVYISLFSVITVSLFFQYSQSLLSIREAKRVLSYIGVGAIAGGVFGGYFACVMVTHYGNIGMLISAIICLVLAAYCLHRVHRKYGSDLIQDKPNSDTESFNGQFIKTIKNKHVAFIACIIGLGVMASKLLDYQFNAAVYAFYTDEESLTAFLGFWFSSINFVSLILQLFLVNKIIDRLGVTNSMSIMPITILLSLIAFLYFPVLAVGAAMKMVDGSMKQSIYKTATEINIMPLSRHLRERAKTLVDVVVDSLATGLSGILIYILINKVTMPIGTITIATIIIVLAWITFILLSKKTYLKQLSNLIYDEDHHDEDIVISPTQYLQQLLSKKPRKSRSRFRELVKLTKNSETPIKSAAIAAVSDEYKYRGLTLLNHLSTDKSILVRKKYLEEKLNYIHSRDELDELYKITSLENQVILTGALARAVGHRLRQQEKFYLRKRVDQAYHYLSNNEAPEILWRTWMTSVAHSRYKWHYETIVNNLKSHDEDMKMYALFAIRRGKLKSLFPHVVDCHVPTINKPRWHKTLATFPNKLLKYAHSLHLTESQELKKVIPAFQYISKQAHLDFLIETIEHPKRKVRIVAFRTIGIIKQKYTYLHFNKRKTRSRLNSIVLQIQGIMAEIALMYELLEKHSAYPDKIKTINQAIVLLKNELSIYMHILFILLELVLDSDAMMKSYAELKTDNKQATIDYLDQLIPYKLKKQVLPLIELNLYKHITKADLQENGLKMMRKNKAVTYLRNLDPIVYEDLIKLI